MFLKYLVYFWNLRFACDDVWTIAKLKQSQLFFFFLVETFICWILEVNLFVSCHYFEWRLWRCFPSKLLYFSFHMPLSWIKDLEVSFIHLLFLCGIWTLFFSSSVTFEVSVVSFIHQCFFLFFFLSLLDLISSCVAFVVLQISFMHYNIFFVVTNFFWSTQVLYLSETKKIEILIIAFEIVTIFVVCLLFVTFMVVYN
jgi:hypothetical protein